jgi:hypothetical protein
LSAQVAACELLIASIGLCGADRIAQRAAGSW